PRVAAPTTARAPTANGPAPSCLASALRSSASPARTPHRFRCRGGSSSRPPCPCRSHIRKSAAWRRSDARVGTSSLRDRRLQTDRRPSQVLPSLGVGALGVLLVRSLSKGAPGDGPALRRLLAI